MDILHRAELEVELQMGDPTRKWTWWLTAVSCNLVDLVEFVFVHSLETATQLQMATHKWNQWLTEGRSHSCAAVEVLLEGLATPGRLLVRCGFTASMHSPRSSI